MKYIRTKDNIFEVENTSPNHIIFCKPRHLKMLVEIDENVYEMKNIINKREIGKDHWKTEIIKQADTIEELCDEFVFHIENQGHWVINNYKRALEIAKSYNEDKNKFICYGAIWTYQGLIYVAKMNDKGELELL